MNKNDFVQMVLPALLLIGTLVGYFLLTGRKRHRMESRIGRVTRRKFAASLKAGDALSLRKVKAAGVPFLSKVLENFKPMAGLGARLERAGMSITPDVYVAICGGIIVLLNLATFLLRKPAILGIMGSLLLGIVIPYAIVGIKGARRIKKFLTLFPDAIDFIVRGLRSGLPATESMNMVGAEMEEPIRSIFSDIGESVRLGVSVEKALHGTARKLNSTEFNFFVTSIVLQRETGGNLSEILSNLADVLRKRFMMRMKIKSMSSEAKASAIIVGALPFVVILALLFVSPAYLDPLINDPRGHIADAIAVMMMGAGIGIMIKMTKFEI